MATPVFPGPSDTVPSPSTGRGTSEFGVAQSAGFWSVVAAVLGGITVIGSAILEQVGTGSVVGIIVGGVVAVVGVVTRTLVALGYIKSRTELKKGGGG